MWAFFAVGASMLWGMMYILSEQLYRKISITTACSITCGVTFLVLLAVSILTGDFKKDMSVISSSPSLRNIFIAEVIVFLLAEICIASSVSQKNATLAGLIEISYPVFIALFAYLLFKENNVNAAVIVGATLIFSGIILIYHYNR